MPRAEVGSMKYLNNKLKSKGLQRLRWYCQVCERQMRDENGFKMHTQSESHVRQMLLIGEDSKKYINDYSNQFQKDFLLQLRTAHGEKKVQMNHFYQEYIANKEHVHMNATKWPSLTEFAKHLGKEGICRVEETDKGLSVAWIDNTPEALRRQDAIRRKERQDKGDEEREQMLIRDQVRRAHIGAGSGATNEEEAERELNRAEGEKIKLDFGSKPATRAESSITSISPGVDGETSLPEEQPKPVVTDTAKSQSPDNNPPIHANTTDGSIEIDDTGNAPKKVWMKMDGLGKPKNVFAAAKKNALGAKKASYIEQPKKMSQAELIMKQEIERKRNRDNNSFGTQQQKRQKL